MASSEHQLVSAVDDKMDPITLLVWCEQNLTPKELPTLNKLLRKDDGSLAQEIGWNLLEMILPMLQEDQQESTICLDCIARRGNPREVIVKVAEVLEKLGEDETSFEAGSGFGDDELPTFPGEADRIHLGTLSLDVVSRESHSAQLQEAEAGQALGANESALTTLQFQSLMSMLGILHLRIKTQYPSRFLATSLPAALGAFRRIGVTNSSTLAFLSLLKQLSGRTPKLPPRPSSTSTNASPLPAPDELKRNRDETTVALPDSEPESEGSSIQQANYNEQAITIRLLQAVLLEAMDDYMASLQFSDPPNLAWAMRVREVSEPQRLVPGKLSDSQKWTEIKELCERDSIIGDFLALCNALKLDCQRDLQSLLDQNGDLSMPPSEDTEVFSSSDYPTEASQIPFPPSGLLFLCAAQQFSWATSPTTKSLVGVTLETVSSLFKFFRSEQNTAYTQTSFSTDDALLTLLYLAKDKPQPVNAISQFNSFFLSLAAFCAEHPDPQLRDSAHNITTTLFHNLPDVKTKLHLSKEMLRRGETPANLKAVVLGWIKDELCTPSREDPPSANRAKIQASKLESDSSLLPLLFACNNIPKSSQPGDEKYDVAELPYYIASLNLICVLATQYSRSGMHALMASAIKGLDEWRSSIRGMEEQMGKEDTSEEVRAPLDEYRTDLWALDDALERSKKVVEQASGSEDVTRVTKSK